MDQDLLSAVVAAWDRNDRIALNLLRSVPPTALGLRATPTSPSVVEMFSHIVYVRLIFVAEDAPEYATAPQAREWLHVKDRERLASGLESSARTVAIAVQDRLQTGQPMLLHYDHPLLFLQHMIWHEGYHHGQIKLALKIAAQPLKDEQAGPLTWGIWTRKTVNADRQS